jgi:DNA-binding NtrC family response regulator
MAPQISHHSTMLIVEDEPIIRMMLVDAFENEGFEILEADNAIAALAHLEARPDVCVMVTDVEMPGQLNGFNLATRAVSTHPDLLIIIMSGRSVPKSGDVPPGARFLQKPFSIEEIISQIPPSINIH